MNWLAWRSSGSSLKRWTQSRMKGMSSSRAASNMSRSSHTGSRPFGIVLLACLYVVQGMPYGFQVGALSMYLREQGTSLQAIGFIGLLALPWSWKALWAPLVDRFGSERFGRRKSWIVPCQLLLMLA